MAENNSGVNTSAVSHELVAFAKMLQEHGLLQTVKEITITHQIGVIQQTLSVQFDETDAPKLTTRQFDTDSQEILPE